MLQIQFHSRRRHKKENDQNNNHQDRFSESPKLVNNIHPQDNDK